MTSISQISPNLKAQKWDELEARRQNCRFYLRFGEATKRSLIFKLLLEAGEFKPASLLLVVNVVYTTVSSSRRESVSNSLRQIGDICEIEDES